MNATKFVCWKRVVVFVFKALGPNNVPAVHRLGLSGEIVIPITIITITYSIVDAGYGNDGEVMVMMVQQ